MIIPECFNDEILTPSLKIFFENRESIIKKIKLTCNICPEQYDCFDNDGRKIAYLRNRGSFSVCCPDCDFGSTIVYESSDYSYGGFVDDTERILALTKAFDAIEDFYREHDVDKVLEEFKNGRFSI